MGLTRGTELNGIIRNGVRATSRRHETWTVSLQRPQLTTSALHRVSSSPNSSSVATSGRSKPPTANVGSTKRRSAVAISPTAASSGKTAPWLPNWKSRNSAYNSNAPKRTSRSQRLKSPNSKMTRKKTDQPGSLLVSSAWRAVFLRSGFFLRRSLPPHRRVSTLCRCGLRCFRPPFRSRYPRPFVHYHSRLGSASGLLRLAVPLAH